MPWGRLDDGLYDHPKLDALGRDRLAGVGLWVLCISWSNRHQTDGLIPRARIGRLGGTVRLAKALVIAGLFDTTPEGYFIHDFLTFNRSRAEIDDDRRTSRERMANVRANKRGTSVSVPSTPSLPDHTRTLQARERARETVGFDPTRIVDERERTPDQQREAYIAAQSKATGVK